MNFDSNRQIFKRMKTKKPEHLNIQAFLKSIIKEIISLMFSYNEQLPKHHLSQASFFHS